MDPQVPTLPNHEAVLPPPQKNNGIVIASMGLFVLISFFALAFLYYQNQQLKTMLASYQTPIASPAPTATADPTTNWKTYSSKTLPLTFKYPSNMKAAETYDLGSSFDVYLSSNEIKMPPPPDGAFTAMQITYLNQYVKTFDGAIQNAKGFFSTDTLQSTMLNAKGYGLKGVLFSGIGVDYWAGRKLSIAVFDRPLAPVIFYFYGDQKDSGFTEEIFNQIVSTVKFLDKATETSSSVPSLLPSQY